MILYKVDVVSLFYWFTYPFNFFNTKNNLKVMKNDGYNIDSAMG